ncbi:histamine H2 receptor-like [Anneissia japonica]|uniref:histamine H2 receptor-like n=1 Tax=Anneissia japonica TaxID=1529436 RepID=UPI001425558D|nr:histamine H2 receptor-like [Anneissia japonica]
MNETVTDNPSTIFNIINESPVSGFCRILTLLIGVVAIAENLVTVLMLCFVRQLRKLQNVLIANLAVVDFLVGVATTWFVTSHLYRSSYNTYSLLSLNSTSNAMFSLIWIFAVSLERFLAVVVAPLRYRYIVNKCRLLISCILIWLFSICFMTCILTMIAFGLYDPKYLQIVYLVYFSMTCTVGIVYLIIFSSVKCQSKRFQTGCVFGAARQARLRSLFFTFAILFGILCLCLLPNQLFMMYVINNQSPNIVFSLDNTFKAVFYDINHMLLPLNSALNPFVYWWRIPEFRQAYTGVFRRCRPKLKCCSVRKRSSVNLDTITTSL